MSDLCTSPHSLTTPPRDRSPAYTFTTTRCKSLVRVTGSPSRKDCERIMIRIAQYDCERITMGLDSRLACYAVLPPPNPLQPLPFPATAHPRTKGTERNRN
ncbi:hypothetical protein J6590_006449 [Homalodisca vitripennis]|nr:hypothetical protein J6590_006449 [Homalodisca vitripennis]